MSFKFKLIFYLMFFCLLCNSQTKKDCKKNSFESETKKTNKPLYLLRHSVVKARLEITINDQLVLKNHRLTPESQDYIFINHFFINEGKQKLKIKIYPIDEVFDEHSSVSIELSKFESKEKWDNWSDSKDQDIFIDYNTDEFKLDSEGNLDGYVKEKRLEGKSYFEKEFNFEANIGIQNIELQNAKNLSLISSDVLKSKVLQQYEIFSRSTINKQSKEFWQIYHQKLNYFAKANFLNEKEIDGLFEEANMYFRIMDYPKKIENYEMVFYAQGRLVCFESKSTDLELRGKSPLVATAVNPKNPKDIFRNPIQFYFYIPQNSTELKVMY